MNVYAELTAPESHDRSAMPKALRDLYYGGTRQDGLLALISTTGYPHNGGQHTLVVRGERTEVVAWLDLFLEEFPDTKPEIDAVKAEIRKGFIREPSKPRLFIKLSDITRQHPYNGELVSKRWFWAPYWEEVA